MTLDAHALCATCAWRSTCAKKHTLRETALHCPDYSRDLTLGAEETVRKAERHKKVDDVFAMRK